MPIDSIVMNESLASERTAAIFQGEPERGLPR